MSQRQSVTRNLWPFPHDRSSSSKQATRKRPQGRWRLSSQCVSCFISWGRGNIWVTEYPQSMHSLIHHLWLLLFSAKKTWSSANKNNNQRWVAAKAKLQQQKLLKRPFANLSLCACFLPLHLFLYFFIFVSWKLTARLLNGLAAGRRNSTALFLWVPTVRSTAAADVWRLTEPKLWQMNWVSQDDHFDVFQKVFPKKKQFLSCLVWMLLFWALVRCEVNLGWVCQSP